MLSRRQANGGLGRVASRTLGLACVCLLFAVRAFAVPAAPANLLATPGNVKVTVTWSAVTGAASYNVYRSLTQGGPYGSPLATGLTAATYTDNAVSNDTTYYYVATAVDGTGEGPRSAEDPATPRAGTFVSGVIGSTSPLTTTWRLANSPYVVVGDVEVRGTVNDFNTRTSTLVIEAGVSVLFEPGTGLFIGDDTAFDGHNGRLQATGATFTSDRTAPAAGDWKGLRFGNTAVDGGTNTFLDGCTVEWAGGSAALAAVVVNQSAPELRNGTRVLHTATGGIHVSDGAAVTVIGGEVEGGSAPAVRVLGFSTLRLTGVTFRGGTYPVQIQPNVVLAALTGNTSESYVPERSGLAVEGGIMGSTPIQSRTWPGGDLSYIVLGDLTVRGNFNDFNTRTSTLVIGAGAQVRFEPGTGLFIGDDTAFDGHNGRLQATGVTFTSNRTAPAAGDWKGLYFGNTAVDGGTNTFLDGCTVEWAGGSAALAAVVVNQSAPELRNGTQVLRPATGGAYVSDGAAVTVIGGEVEGGSAPAVRVLGFSTLRLTGVTFRGGTYPVQIQPNVVLAALTGNALESYAPEHAGLAVEGGIMGSIPIQSRTWPGGDLPYIVLGDLTVRGNFDDFNTRTSTLVIGTGAQVRFEPGTGLFIGDDTPFDGHLGRLQATGATFTTNRTAPAAGDWKGLRFGHTTVDGGSNTFLDGCTVEWAGGSAALAAVVVNRSALELRNGTRVLGPATGGVHVSDEAAVTMIGGEVEGGSAPAVRVLGFSTLSLTGVTFRGGTYPVQIQPNVVLAALTGNTLASYAPERAGVAVEGGVMGSTSVQSRMWPGGDLPYIVLGDLAVRGNFDDFNTRTSTLVIGAGAQVRFEPGTGLFIGDDTTFDGHLGRLQATGATFTSNRTAPAAGDWKGLRFGHTTVDGGANTFLDGCTVEWAGGSAALAAVIVNQSAPELRNGTRVLRTATGGIHVSDGAAVTVIGGEVEGGSAPAARVLGFSSLSLTGVTFRGGTYPVQIQPNVVLAALTANVLENYAAERAGLAVEGGVMGSSLVQSRTWPGGDLPYIVLGDLTVRGNFNDFNTRTSTLVIGAEAQVRFEPGTGLFIGDDTTFDGHLGRLQATGATFTSNRTAPAAGDWKGLRFGHTTVDGGTNTFLDGCTVEWAGGSAALAAVIVNQSALELRNGRVLSTATGGVHVSDAAAVTVLDSEIEGGTEPAIRILGFSQLSLKGTTLRGDTYPVQIQPNVVLAALSGNRADGYPHEQAGIAVEGGVMGSASIQSRTWPGRDLPYVVLADLTVRGNFNDFNDRTSTLVIGSGAEILFKSGAGLFVGDDTTFDGHQGKLQATGAIFSSARSAPAPGDWKGIRFGNTTIDGGPNTFLDGCTVEWAGGPGGAAAIEVNQSSVELRKTIVRQTASVGVHVADGSAITIMGSEIEGGTGPGVKILGFASLSLIETRLRKGAYPVQIQPNVVLTALRANAAEGYPREQSGIAVEAGVMGSSSFQSRTWPGGDLPYIVLGDLSVRGNFNDFNDRTSTLVIGSGAEVRFAAGAGLSVGDDSGFDGGHRGRLQATGVTFTASSATPVPGFWKGIYFADLALDGAANTFLDACTVEWAGGDFPGAVWVNASAPVFKNGFAVRGTATSGVYLSSSSASQLTLLGGEVEGGADAAVRAAGNSTLLLRDVTLRGGPYPVRIDPNVNVAGLRGSRAESYPFERAAVAVESGVLGSSGGAQTRVWPAADLPFLVLGEVQVRGNQSTGSDRTSLLVLQSGGEVRFERGASLQIGDDSGIEGGHWGALRASGVTFTANTLSPVPGFWNGLYFADQTRDDLSFLFDGSVEHGGGAGANVTIYRSSPYLSGVAIRGSGQDGILASLSSAVVTGSRLAGGSSGLRLVSSGALALMDGDVEGNSRFGAFNGAPSSLFARFNWWGYPSGPLDPVSNPGGLGDRVSERVDYTPWLTASPLPPVAPASVTAQPADGAVTVAWSANPERDVTGYNVYRRLPPATAWTLRTSSPVPAPSYQDAGLTNRAGHCYQVRAVDSQGREGDPSREVCATPRTDVTAPAWTGPAGALFAEGSAGRAVVRFEPAADSSTVAYDLYYSTVSPIDRSLPGVGRITHAAPVASSAGHTLEVAVPGLIDGRRYFFNLQAMDAEGNADGNATEATAVIGPVSGALVAASPWTGAALDGAVMNGEGRIVLASGRTEGQLTSSVLELPAGADLSAVAWNAVSPSGTAVDTVPGGALTLEVRAADDPAHLADVRCIAPTGLTAWWPGDGNGRDVQAGRDGVLRNGGAFAAGRSGGAFRLDGMDDYVEPTVDVSETAYTLSLWFKTSCGDCGLFSVDEGTLGGNGNDRHLYLSNGRLCTRVWNNETICTTASGYADERWHHAVHVFGGAVGGQKIFVDGVQRASGSKASSDFNWQTGVNLGFSNDAANGFFRGLLDEVAVFNRALTAAEIQALYAAGGPGLCKPDADGDGVADPADACPATPARNPVDVAGCPGGCFGPPANRVSWWRGEGNASDSAGTNAGTLVGGTTFDLGQVGQAFRFDGVNDRVEIPNLGSFTRVTAQAWVYREGATNTRESLISYELGCGIVLSLNENGVSQLPRLWVNINGGWQFTEGAQPLPFGRWTHLAGTYDGQEIRLYVDGVLAAVTPAAGNMTQCNEKVALGSRRSFDQYFFPGRLDEVTIFDRALSASEIQALAEARGAGMCATAPPPSGAPAGTPQVTQGWVQVMQNQPVDLPDGRYVQVRITLRGDGTQSPALRSVSLGYRGGGQ